MWQAVFLTDVFVSRWDTGSCKCALRAPQIVAELKFCVMLIRLILDTWREQADKPSKISCTINVMVMQKAAAVHELGGYTTSLLICTTLAPMRSFYNLVTVLFTISPISVWLLKALLVCYGCGMEGWFILRLQVWVLICCSFLVDHTAVFSLTRDVLSRNIDKATKRP